MGGAGDGEGGEGEGLRSSPSISTKVSGGSLRVLDLTVAVVIEAPDSVDRVDLVDFGFVAALRVDLGFESDLAVVACVCGLGLDLGEATRFVGGGSVPKLCSSSEVTSRDLLPLRFGFSLALALGLESDLAGDEKSDLTSFVASPVIRVSSTFGAGEPVDRTPLSPS